PEQHPVGDLAAGRERPAPGQQVAVAGLFDRAPGIADAGKQRIRVVLENAVTVGAQRKPGGTGVEADDPGRRGAGPREFGEHGGHGTAPSDERIRATRRNTAGAIAEMVLETVIATSGTIHQATVI